MKMVYAALLLHSLGKKIDEESVRNVMQAAGAEIDEAQLKALVANLSNINIDEVIKNAMLMQATTSTPSEKAGEAKEEKKEEKMEEKAEEAAAGLSALFG
jgi:large subunit ribosomal protein L12